MRDQLPNKQITNEQVINYQRTLHMDSPISSDTRPIPAAPLTEPAYEIVRYGDIEGTPCPCGRAKRGLLDSPLVPFSLHLTTIAATARVHYHRHITETYLILECDEGSYMELNGERLAVAPEMAIVIPPGTRHRAVGKIKVAIVAWPKFDPADEWFDD